MLFPILSIICAAFGAYSIFCSGLHSMSAHVTSMLIPFRRNALASSIVGAIFLAASLYLMYIS